MKFAVQRAGTPVRMRDELFYLVTLAVLAAITAAIVSNFALFLHRNFLTIACDTAVLQSAIVNTLHGDWFRNNGAGGPSILGAHTTFLLLLTLPVYVLAPSPDTLFVLQVFGVYGIVIPLYLIAGDLLRQPLAAFCVATAAMASPLLLHMAFSPFHLETWIAAGAFWSYFFYLRNNLAGFLASLAGAVCCGEQAALIYIALGVALLAVDDGLAWRKRYGRVALLAGLTWIILAVMIVAPLARGSRSFNIFAYNYSQWGIQSVLGLPLALARHPVRALALLASPVRWAHVAGIIGLPLLGTFFSWRSLILLAPLPVYLLMSDQEFFLYFHAYYYSFAFFAGYLGVVLFVARRGLADRLGLVILAGTFFVNVLLLCNVAGFYFQLSAGAEPEFTAMLHQEFDQIPPEATVYTPHRYSAYLSNRQNMIIGDLRDTVDFNAMVNAQFAETNVRPGQVDYIVCDYVNDQCGWRQSTFNPAMIQVRTANVDRLLHSGEWKLFWSQNDVVILRRSGK
jgi:uncharacterized membrane protein